VLMSDWMLPLQQQLLMPLATLVLLLLGQL
jgi:hypothetical protein